MHNNQFQAWMAISNSRFSIFAIAFSPNLAANINFGFELTEKLEISFSKISKVKSHIHKWNSWHFYIVYCRIRGSTSTKKIRIRIWLLRSNFDYEIVSARLWSYLVADFQPSLSNTNVSVSNRYVSLTLFALKIQ